MEDGFGTGKQKALLVLHSKTIRTIFLRVS